MAISSVFILQLSIGFTHYVLLVLNNLSVFYSTFLAAIIILWSCCDWTVLVLLFMCKRGPIQETKGSGMVIGR